MTMKKVLEIKWENELFVDEKINFFEFKLTIKIIIYYKKLTNKLKRN